MLTGETQGFQGQKYEKRGRKPGVCRIHRLKGSVTITMRERTGEEEEKKL